MTTSKTLSLAHCRRLERASVDVDQLEIDFVSRQAVHTYLTAVHGVTDTADESDPIEREATNIRRLKRWLATITNGYGQQTSSCLASSTCCWICVCCARTAPPSISSSNYLPPGRVSVGKTLTKIML